MTVAVTGASGHIGANLVRMLKDSGRDVRAMVHRNTRALDGLDVALIHGDVLNPSSVRQLFCGAQVVYHLAGVITLRSRTNDSALSTNVEGVRNVIDACRACGVKFLVHFSSIHAFSETPADGVVDEQRPLCRDEDALPYDRSKAAGEQIVREAVAAGLPAVIINPTAVLGPHDYKPSAMGRVLLDLCRGRLPVLVQGGFNWVDVRDVCGAAIRAENLRAAGRQYLVGGQYLALKEFADLVG
jgi:dihydroflavonol-4-reductase